MMREQLREMAVYVGPGLDAGRLKTVLNEQGGVG